MKPSTIIICIFILSLFSNCDKSDDASTTRVNCDGLVTDTAGTGDPARIYIPNAFTPNGDGINDGFKPIMQNIQAITFTIFDENNNVVFLTTDINQGWSPQFSTAWTKYYFKIQATTSANHKIGKCGDLYKLACFPSSMPQSTFYFQDQLTPNGFTGVTAETLSTCP